MYICIYVGVERERSIPFYFHILHVYKYIWAFLKWTPQGPPLLIRLPDNTPPPFFSEWMQVLDFCVEMTYEDLTMDQVDTPSHTSPQHTTLSVKHLLTH